MKTPEFNLLEEAWIRVLKDDCSEELVSLPEAMIHAHEYGIYAGIHQNRIWLFCVCFWRYCTRSFQKWMKMGRIM